MRLRSACAAATVPQPCRSRVSLRRITATPCFRTEIHPAQLPCSLDYGSKTVLLGSCLADNIGAIMLEHKLSASVNPLGTIFNPLSICKVINLALQSDPDPRIQVQNDADSDLFFSYDFHSNFSATDAESCRKRIVSALQALRVSLLAANFLVITLGTAWVYRRRSNGEVVSNCHKMPPKLFSKELLQVPAVVSCLESTIRQLQQLNPSLHVVLTISPVRHWKDGPVPNQVSKSTLVLAAHQLQQHLGQGGLSYFPAYELLLDDLRDYRFYDSDLLHPSDDAVQYIWRKLQACWLSPAAREAATELKGLLAAVRHRPQHPGTAKHQRFVRAALQKLESFQKRHPAVDLSPELQQLRANLLVLD